MTMELFVDSDVETVSEISSDDQDDIFSMYSGHAQSILSSLEDSIEKIDDFLSFERGFTHGDIVRSTGNPSGQMGKIVNIKMLVDVENVFGEVIKDVDSGKLLRMRSILVGDYVIRGPWLGRVEKVVDNVNITFDNGAKSEIMATDQAQLVPLSPNLLDDSLYPYHPGQRVRVSHPTASKSSGWLSAMSKKNRLEGIVYSVDVGLAYVDWISSALVGVSMTVPPPTRLQEPKNLTLLSCSTLANWQLGDWCILPSETRSQRSINSNVDEIFSIAKIKVKVDVMWQDGSCSMGLDSHSLFPVNVLNGHDFFPKQFVMEKTSSDDLLTAPASRRWGVVRCVDANEMTVMVKWESMDGSTEDVDEGKMEETLSAYELVEHPDFSFNIGDIVFMSDKNHYADQLNNMSVEDKTALVNGGCDADLSEIEKRCFMSCIGYVVGFINGNIVVEWAGGVTTKVAPYKILRVEKDDGSVATHGFQEDNVAEFNVEMTNYERQSVTHQDVSDSSSNAAIDRQSNHRSSNIFSLSQAAMGFFTSIAGNLFRLHRSTSLPQHMSCSHVIDENKIGSFDEEAVVESCDMFPDVHTDFDAYGRSMSSKQEVDKNSENIELVSASKNKDLKQCKQFDVVEDCSDNLFANGKGAALSQMKKSWLKKVQQEWTILEKDLPETIYVRIYEERMDLLRAAIVGAPGTPYHDGLFFFDIMLPPDYPHVPPLVHYHSGGLRLNPNLYESGKVCLSLLNTWTGTGSEVWNPGSSTILQVLLSLQALVLNEKPYFNEAGYDQQIGRAEGENNSVSYNENAYLGTCKCMLYLLRKPPKHFEELVKVHFERRSQHILSACKAYMEGVPIGLWSKVEHEKGNSTGFKIMLAKLFPKLVQAFSDRGIDCSQFTEPQI